MSHVVDRRTFCRTTLAAVVASPILGLRPCSQAAAAAPAASAPFTLGFSLYGMNGLPIDEAIRACALIGYRDVEPALMPGYSGDPAGLSTAKRKDLRGLIDSLGLAVPVLMENLRAIVDDTTHAANLERLARAAELGHTLSASPRPIIETVLGGKPDEWQKVRSSMLDRLRDWAEAARKHEIIVAVKPHVSNALHLPEDAAKFVDEIGSPHLRAAYDYSHYQAQGLPLAETLAALVDHSVFVHVKDGRVVDGKTQFLLPGEGTTDYVEYFKLLRKHGYRGSVCVEVSGMIHSKPGYDPIAAARKSFATLQAAVEKSAG